MLLSLHVKNLALIEEEEVTFSDGLNILTGETGAGKSIIIGSVNLALGAKADKSLIRTGCEYALIELIFRVDNERQRAGLRAMELSENEDGTILIKRKIFPGRSTCTIEGETVTIGQLRAVSELLIDVYGQRENQKLLRREAQLDVIDDFAGKEAAALKTQIAAHWDRYQELQKKYRADDLDTASRAREIDLLSYEVREIEEAALKKGEDEELEAQFRVMSNFQRISAAAQAAGSLTEDEDGSAGSQISRALRELRQAGGLAPELDDIADQLADIDSLLSDFGRSLQDYVDGLSFDPDAFREIETRLNLINHLKDKYGRSLQDIQNALRSKQDRLQDLSDYDAARSKLSADIEKEHAALLKLCGELSNLRKTSAGQFEKQLTKELMDLNFNQVNFQVRQESDESLMGPEGYDRVTFYISMNPGESPRPMDLIASGGELSRIMLAMKTVFAWKDEIYAFVFDEIDSGISGQTAWKVAEKLGKLSRDHQILCITHLPQIAAMEDAHYRIAKTTDGSRTMTHIKRLSEEESVQELGRLLGGAVMTEATLENAREMKKMAAQSKEQD